MKTLKLRNGVEMPIEGYGVYQVDPAVCERCVSDGGRASASTITPTK